MPFTASVGGSAPLTKRKPTSHTRLNSFQQPSCPKSVDPLRRFRRIRISTPIHLGRFTADHQQPITVFLIGMRINKLHRVDKWLPVAGAIRPMIAELTARPESGFLGAESMLSGLRTLVFLQYWRSFDCLEAYATDRNQSHLPAWKNFYRQANSGAAVGIFHETYSVDPGRFETVYGNMPNFGLGKVAGVVAAEGARNKARARMVATATITAKS